MVWDHFQKTPPMSPHLLAFTITDFDSVVSKENVNPVVKIWAPKYKIRSVSYALECVARLLKFFETYLKIKYPLPKLDIVVVTNNPLGAISNWGIIFAKDINVIQGNSEEISWEEKLRIFNSMAKLLAYQWFGNFVTMDWWSHTWINEGLSTYLARVAEENVCYSKKIIALFYIKNFSLNRIGELKMILL